MTLEVNDKLTPENALDMGFEWIKDVIYDPEGPDDVFEDLRNLLNKGEHVLGLCAGSNPENNLFGLYKRID